MAFLELAHEYTESHLEIRFFKLVAGSARTGYKIKKPNFQRTPVYTQSKVVFGFNKAPTPVFALGI